MERESERMRRPKDFKVGHMKQILHILLDKLESYDDNEDIGDVRLNAVILMDDDFWDGDEE